MEFQKKKREILEQKSIFRNTANLLSKNSVINIYVEIKGSHNLSRINTTKTTSSISFSNGWKANKKSEKQSVKKKMHIIYRVTRVRTETNFSLEKMSARRQQKDIFKVMKEEQNCQTRILYLKNCLKIKAK